MNEAESLRRLISYDPATGQFVRMAPKALFGKVAAPHEQSCGYMQIVVNRRLYYAHRLAWLLMTGAWPASQVDHIDGDRKNNRFANLREASPSENQQNIKRKSNNTSGFPGVSWSNKAQLWKAQIGCNGRKKHISYRATPEEAYSDYLREKQRLHTFQPVPRGMLK